MLKENYKKAVVSWLLTGAVMIFLMTAIGGITRLTDSGLSMVDWNLIMGAVPPSGQQEWEAAFDAYKAYPEYKYLHHHFTLEDFKKIFFWEYLHRLIGRLLGVVFIVPFVFFVAKGVFDRKQLVRLLILLAMGAFQGFMGWYMVKSGLVKVPRVSHFRLAAHLLTAFATISYIVWIVIDLLGEGKQRIAVDRKFRNWNLAAFVLLVLQIVYGAFVAGKDAGLIHNFWPHMNPGEFVSPAVFSHSPWWANFTENSSGIQFLHRYLAYVVFGLLWFLWFRSREIADAKLRRGYTLLAVLVSLQFLLGVLTLVFHVPLVIALLHQLGALLLLLAFVFVLRIQKPAVLSK